MAKKQKMLVAVNVNCKCGIILEHFGDDIHREIELYTIWLEDLGFTDVPGFGLWIWDGYGKYDVDSKTETYDVEWIGNWRYLNNNEIDKVTKGERLWNYQPPKKEPVDG